jgi:hypothetical protein
VLKFFKLRVVLLLLFLVTLLRLLVAMVVALVVAFLLVGRNLLLLWLRSALRLKLGHILGQLRRWRLVSVLIVGGLGFLLLFWWFLGGLKHLQNCILIYGFFLAAVALLGLLSFLKVC